MSENHTVQHPLPDGVYDNFTYQCVCGGTVTVIGSVSQPHHCTLTARPTGFPPHVVEVPSSDAAEALQFAFNRAMHDAWQEGHKQGLRDASGGRPEAAQTAWLEGMRHALAWLGLKQYGDVMAKDNPHGRVA